MIQDLSALKEAVEHLEYQKKKHVILLDELNAKKEEQKKAKKILDKENKDVEKVVGVSFASFMATLLNNKSEKLEKEELEALEAKHAYDAISYEVQALSEEIGTLEAAIGKEDAIKGAYQKAYDRKKKELSSQSPALWQKIKALDVDLNKKRAELKEIKEAKSACSQTLGSIYNATKQLSDAKSYGTWDMLGGGFLATMAKREHMNKAQNAINDVNYHLKRLKKELLDINEEISLKIEIDNYLSFADYFFDGLFVDIMVQNKISDAQDKVSSLKNDIEVMHKRLENMYLEVEATKNQIKDKMDEVIVQASL